MRSKRKSSKSTKKLTLNQEHRKLKLSRSSHKLVSPLKSGSYCKSTSQSQSFTLPHQQENSFSLFIGNPLLRQQFEEYPIRHRFQWLEGGLSNPRKNMVVVSKIEEFYQQYNQLCGEDQEQPQQVEWIILSQAVNSTQIETEFNERYQPVKFLFLPSMAFVVNHLSFFRNAKKHRVSLDYFSSIINFQAFPNQFTCIQQIDPKQISSFAAKAKQLWLIDHAHRHLLKGIQLGVYFIEGLSVKNNKIQIPTDQSLIFVVEKDHNQVISTKDISQPQFSLSLPQIRKLMLCNQHPRYCQKVAKLLQIDLIFGLMNFPDKIVKEFCKHFSNVAVFRDRSVPHSGLFLCIYYGKKQENDCLGIQFNSSAKLENQIFRIKSHCQAVQKLKAVYEQLPSKVDRIKVIAYNVRSSQLVQQIELFTGSIVTWVSNVSSLYQCQPESTVVLGEFKPLEKKPLLSMTDLFVIDLEECSHDFMVVHNQLAICLKNMLKKDQSFAFLTVSSQVVSFNVDLSELVSKPHYVNRPLEQFDEQLNRLEQNYHHLLVLNMNDYNEILETAVKEAQRQKHLSFEIYLQYGKEFIIRNKAEKYTFISRGQLIGRINEINSRAGLALRSQKALSNSVCEDYYNSFPSAHTIDNTYHLGKQSSTYQGKSQGLLVVIPKKMFNNIFYNILHRFADYTILLYHNLQQLRYFSRHVGKNYQAVVLVDHEGDFSRQNIQQNVSIIPVGQLNERQIREQIERKVSNFVGKDTKYPSNKMKKGIQSVVLFDREDSKQSKMCAQMDRIFRLTKIISLSKQELKQITKNHDLNQNIAFYELGAAELEASKKIKNITQLLKIYMAPIPNSLCFYSSISIQFSYRQKYLHQYYGNEKTSRLKGKLHEISLTKKQSKSLSRSQLKSPSLHNKNLKTKDYLFKPGLTVVESEPLSRRSKGQKFSTEKQLISLLYCNLQKGNTVLVVTYEKQFESFRNYMGSSAPGVIWIVVVTALKFLLIKSTNVIYCLSMQVDNVLKQTAESFNAFMEKQQISRQKSEYFFNESEQIQVFDEWKEYIKGTSHLAKHKLSIIADQSFKRVVVDEIGEALILRNPQKINSIMSLSQGLVVNKEDSLCENERKEVEEVIILVHSRNKFFIEHCLSLLEETNCIIASFTNIYEVVKYAQITKTLLVLEKNDDLIISGALYLNSSDTPASFNRRLRMFLDSLRKWN